MWKETRGVWRQSAKITPRDEISASSQFCSHPGGVSCIGMIPDIVCGKSGICVATATYTTRHHSYHSLELTNLRGSWTAAEKSFPLSGLSCNLTRDVCVATTNSGMVIESRGVWGAPQAIPSALLANYTQSQPPTVVCASSGSCAGSSTGQGPVLATYSHGHWSRPEPLAPPADAVSGGSSALSALACPSVGNCTAVGIYLTKDPSTGADTERALAVNEVNGVWGAGYAVGPEPTFGASGLQAVACASPTSCTALGFAKDPNVVVAPHGRPVPVIDLLLLRETSGRWESTYAAKNIESVSSLSCAPFGTCAATVNHYARFGPDIGHRKAYFVSLS
jgi:hypothetical protein